MNRLLYGFADPRAIDIKREVCPSCQGWGGKWFAINHIDNECIEVSKEQFNRLPINEEIATLNNEKFCQCEYEECPQCNGDGYIDIEPVDYLGIHLY